MLVDAYFEEPDAPLPKAFLMRFEGEPDKAYIERVRLYMKQMGDLHFSKLAHRIDPKDPLQKRFFALYLDIQKQRENI